jgi:hypothetical protein
MPQTYRDKERDKKPGQSIGVLYAEPFKQIAVW